jgi:hypothetical protein
MSAPTSADALAEQAEHTAENDPRRAVALARQALLGDSDNARALNVLGVLAYMDGRLAESAKLLGLACSSPGADTDMQANLERVRAELGLLGYDPSSTRLGELLARDREPGVVARLAEIPSATTPGERNLMRQFTAELWNGRDHVFENGPLLGGTTRAIALGMLANPLRDSAARLHTHDWFNSTVPLDVPPESLDQLIRRGLLDPAARDEMDRTGSFKPVFDNIHSGHDYSEVLVSRTAALPGSPVDEQAMANLYEPVVGATWGLLLIDGCKSWYGTRYFMQRTADQIPRGSYMLIQDFGWYSCFWLTSMIGMFAERFKLLTHTHTTYAFEVLDPVLPAEVAEHFPESPQQMGADAFDELYAEWQRRIEPLGDSLLRQALTIHHAGALAYIGDKERARAMIDDLAQQPWAAPHLGTIGNARRYPTYTPTGRVEL